MRRELRTEEELVLLVAGTRDRRQGSAARLSELVERTPWEAVLNLLAYQGLVPLLGGRIVEAAAERAPAEFVRAVWEETAAYRRAGTLLELTTLRIASALESAGVPNVPLKGPLLARALHGDPGMRYSRDIDVLVSRSDLVRAAAALKSLGWHSEAASEKDPVLHLRLRHEGALPEVELHWRLHWYETEFSAQALTRARPGPEGVRRLQAGDDLVALILYQARDGFAGLRHSTDIAAWWDANQDDTATPLLVPILRAHPSLRRPLTASAAFLERLVGVPAHRLVAQPRRLPRGSHAAVALANPLMLGEPHQITAEVSLVDGLLAPRGQRKAFFRRRVLPRASELPDAASGRPLAIARGEHILRLLRRYALALVRTRPVLP
jgi:hypothetical protein